MSESASTRSHHPRERLVDDLELVLGRRGVGVPGRVGGPNLELVLALVQVLHLRRRGAALPRLLVLLALERRAVLVGAELELDLALLGLVRRALGDLGLGRVGVRGASAAAPAPASAPASCGARPLRGGVARALILGLVAEVVVVGVGLKEGRDVQARVGSSIEVSRGPVGQIPKPLEDGVPGDGEGAGTGWSVVEPENIA